MSGSISNSQSSSTSSAPIAFSPTARRFLQISQEKKVFPDLTAILALTRRFAEHPAFFELVVTELEKTRSNFKLLGQHSKFLLGAPQTHVLAALYTLLSIRPIDSAEYWKVIEGRQQEFAATTDPKEWLASAVTTLPRNYSKAARSAASLNISALPAPASETPSPPEFGHVKKMAQSAWQTRLEEIRMCISKMSLDGWAPEKLLNKLPKAEVHRRWLNTISAQKIAEVLFSAKDIHPPSAEGFWLLLRLHADKIRAEPKLPREVERLIAAVHTFQDACPKAPFPVRQLALVEHVLVHSLRPQEDLAIIFGTAGTDSSTVTLDTVREYYSSGKLYIAHAAIFYPKSEEASNLAKGELEVRKLLSRSHISDESRECIVEDYVARSLESPALAPLLRKILSSMIQNQRHLDHFGNLLKVCTPKKIGPEVIGALEAIPKYGKFIEAACDEFTSLMANPERNRDELLSLSKMQHPFSERASVTQHLDSALSFLRDVPVEQLNRAFHASDIETPVPRKVFDNAIERYSRAIAHARKITDLKDLDFTASAKALPLPGSTQREIEQFQETFFAYAGLAMQRAYSIVPYHSQILTPLMMLDSEFTANRNGTFAQVNTGEGKSIVIALLAAYHAKLGRKVDIITSNDYLAQRDAVAFSPFYKLLGLSPNVFDYFSNQAADQTAPILYTTNNSLIFARLQAKLAAVRNNIGMRSDVAIVDEADNLFLDKPSEICRISWPAITPVTDQDLKSMLEFASKERGLVETKPLKAGTRFLELNTHLKLSPLTCSLYLKSALTALRGDIRMGVDYIVENERVVTVDVGNTGRKLETQWMHGLTDFLALQLKLKTNPPCATVAELGHTSFLLGYQNRYCLSGTFGRSTERDRPEISSTFNVVGFDVPPNRPRRRIDDYVKVYSGASWERALVKRTVDMIEKQRPTLHIAHSVADSKTIEAAHNKARISTQLLNGTANHDENGKPLDEHNIVKRAGTARMATIATGMAGRGADIPVEKDVSIAGGLHVVISSIPLNGRIEQQARGRAARQGNPGSTEMIVSLERDPFLNKLPPNIYKTIKNVFQMHGGTGMEMRKIISAVQICVNAEQSLFRSFTIERDRQVQKLQQSYFDLVSETADNLLTNNRELGNRRVAATFVSAHLRKYWTEHFAEFSNKLHFRHSLTNLSPAEYIEGAKEHPVVKELLAFVSNSRDSLLTQSRGPWIREQIEGVFNSYRLRLLGQATTLESPSDTEVQSEIELHMTNLRQLAQQCDAIYKHRKINPV